VGVMYFTYAGDTMFPDTKIAKKYSSGPGPEKSVALMPRTCGFYLRESQ